MNEKNLILLVFSLMSCIAHAQEKYMFVSYKVNKKSASEVPDSLPEKHLTYIKQLADEGKLLMSGPLEYGGSILILNTQSAKEAREWLKEDPAVWSGLYRIEILPWNARIGHFCHPDHAADYERYTFIRYNTFITKFNVRQAPVLFQQHDVHLKKLAGTGNVLLEGYFENSDGGIMIMQGHVEHEVLTADPSVKNGIIQPEVTHIWLKPGSICDKR